MVSMRNMREVRLFEEIYLAVGNHGPDFLRLEFLVTLFSGSKTSQDIVNSVE
jgi:hypothetical protein